MEAATNDAYDFVLVDGLEYLTTGQQNQERGVLLCLCDFARQASKAVLCTLTLGPEAERRADKRPLFRDLREWQGAETFCAKVVFCYRDELYYGPNSVDHGLVETIVAKSIDGFSGTAKFRFLEEKGALYSPTSLGPDPTRSPD
ncbi:hypothetical protein PAGU2638_24610 [Lysobacter sp. PAGU 2638]